MGNARDKLACDDLSASLIDRPPQDTDADLDSRHRRLFHFLTRAEPIHAKSKRGGAGQNKEWQNKGWQGEFGGGCDGGDLGGGNWRLLGTAMLKRYLDGSDVGRRPMRCFKIQHPPAPNA